MFSKFKYQADFITIEASYKYLSRQQKDQKFLALGKAFKPQGHFSFLNFN